MQVFNVKSKVASDGLIHIDVPTQLPQGADIEAVVVISPTEKDKQNYNFSDLAGKLSWKGDALLTQKKIRDEWP